VIVNQELRWALLAKPTKKSHASIPFEEGRVRMARIGGHERAARKKRTAYVWKV
jgi:hypothetical protein